MKNIGTLLYFMQYFEPHCIKSNGQQKCYVSALEYPEPIEALEAIGGSGFFADGPTSIVLKYAKLIRGEEADFWKLADEATPGALPVWEAR